MADQARVARMAKLKALRHTGSASLVPEEDLAPTRVFTSVSRGEAPSESSGEEEE